MAVKPKAAMTLLAAVGLMLGCGAVGAGAQTAGIDRTASSSYDAFAQARSKSKRARTRIRVNPIYPYSLESTPYPKPYDIEFPGPGFVRQCSARLVQENRPSGTVFVPRMRCWWERG